MAQKSPSIACGRNLHQKRAPRKKSADESHSFGMTLRTGWRLSGAVSRQAQRLWSAAA
jgi:hypothetical protein